MGKVYQRSDITYNAEVDSCVPKIDDLLHPCLLNAGTRPISSPLLVAYPSENSQGADVGSCGSTVREAITLAKAGHEHRIMAEILASASSSKKLRTESCI